MRSFTPETPVGRPPGAHRAPAARLLAIALMLSLVATAAIAPHTRAADAPWPGLRLRGFALYPAFQQGTADLVDTTSANASNKDEVVTLVWDRDSLAETRPDFGGYAVYRAQGPFPTRAVLLRRYIKQPDISFGTGNVDPQTGSESRLWTFRLRQGNIGLFIDPDSIYSFDRIPFLHLPVSNPPRFDTAYVRTVLPGPKNGFDYYYYVTVVDTTINGEDLTERSANSVGPIRPTGFVVPNNLEVIRVLPNPYQFRADWDLPGARKIRFIRLPARCTIEIYSAAGDKVRVLEHNNPLDNGEDWNVKNGAGNEVGGGIYIWRISTPEGRERIGRLTVVR